MRKVSLIFSFYLLSLATIIPAFSLTTRKTDVTHSQKSCWHKTKKDFQPKDENKKCPKGNHTPMFMCPKIQIAVHEPDEIPVVPSSPIKEVFSDYIESYYTTHLFAAWHPPRV